MTGDEHDESGVTPTDAELAAAAGQVNDALNRLGMDLDDAVLWREPDPNLEDRIVAAVAPAPESEPPRMRPAGVRIWRWVGAAAIVAALLGLVGLAQRNQPDWTVELGGTDDFPLAGGVVEGWNLASGTRMVLDMTGVEEAPEGFFYEMWLSDGPLHISAGTFVDVAAVELRAGVTRRDYPRLWVTLELIDEDESPSAVVVVDTGR